MLSETVLTSSSSACKWKYITVIQCGDHTDKDLGLGTDGICLSCWKQAAQQTVRLTFQDHLVSLSHGFCYAASICWFIMCVYSKLSGWRWQVRVKNNDHFPHKCKLILIIKDLMMLTPKFSLSVTGQFSCGIFQTRTGLPWWVGLLFWGIHNLTNLKADMPWPLFNLVLLHMVIRTHLSVALSQFHTQTRRSLLPERWQTAGMFWTQGSLVLHLVLKQILSTSQSASSWLTQMREIYFELLEITI